MNNGVIIKSGIANNSDLELINHYTRRELSADDLYCFSLVLCDNEIDRDFEQFPSTELNKIAELFIGKTGILDHNPSAKNQCARIYRCRIDTETGRTNSVGENYARVIADAYIPKTGSSIGLIEDIEAGIKKEVSIGCSVKKVVCSICGQDLNSPECCHRKGQIYQNKLCYGMLTDISDAYEWSFVAVPAQKHAGVIKSKMFGKNALNSIIKKLDTPGATTIEENEKAELTLYIEKLNNLYSDAQEYRRELENDITRLNALNEHGIPSQVLSSIIGRMTISELKAFKHAFAKNQAQPQLFVSRSNNKNNLNYSCCDDYNI